MKKALSEKSCNSHDKIYPSKETEFDGSDLKATPGVAYSFYIFYILSLE